MSSMRVLLLRKFPTSQLNLHFSAFVHSWEPLLIAISNFTKVRNNIGESLKDSLILATNSYFGLLGTHFYTLNNTSSRWFNRKIDLLTYYWWYKTLPSKDQNSNYVPQVWRNPEWNVTSYVARECCGKYSVLISFRLMFRCLMCW